MAIRSRHLLLVALLGTGLFWTCSEEEEPLVYRLAPIGVRDIVVSASAEGVVEPIETVDVKSKASGEIVEVKVEVGDEVRRGDVLVRVDPRTAQNAVDQAEADLAVAQAQLENAQSQLERAERLYQTGAITEQDWEQARLDQATAKARLIGAQRTLEDNRIAFQDTEVRAASNGIILTRQVEAGTVIQSASSGMGGGAVLLTMADLDTIQVRSLVNETDIGKIEPGLDVTILVDAYPERPFRGSVLKIEPEALIDQNVTVFPVLMRIPNPNTLLKPGMNAEVEVHIGYREGVLAIPNAALRTQRDLFSALALLGMDMETAREQIDAARRAQEDTPEAVAMGEGKPEEADSNRVTFRGRAVELPAGLTAAQVRPVLAKIESGGFEAMRSLSPDERAIMQQLRGVLGAGGARGGAGGGSFGGGQRPTRPGASQFKFGGEFIAFVLRNGMPQATPIRTGLTDLDYSEVVTGLTARDTVLILPSESLVQSQQEWQERANRMAGGGMFGGNNR
jgi:HlyD family secretion protein